MREAAEGKNNGRVSTEVCEVFVSRWTMPLNQILVTVLYQNGMGVEADWTVLYVPEDLEFRGDERSGTEDTRAKWIRRRRPHH